jgi:ZIP family zinc transporter
VSLGEMVGLGAIAGGTIYIGLPIARLKNPPRTLQGFLTAVATGILFFLLYDVLAQAIDPVQAAVHHGSRGDFVLYLCALVIGLTVGLLALVGFEQRFLRREPGTVLPGRTLALMIAAGIGLHNFSEGLAIGQSAATGEVQLAVLLIVGFGLHNTTEGFGISAPLAGTASWGFIGLAGLIGGGPTFLGTILGINLHSEFVYVLFLSLAAGSIMYVLSQLLPLVRRMQMQQLVMSGLVMGFTAAFATDLVLVAAGA